MMQVEEIIEWLQSFPAGTMIGIDDGGLAIRPESVDKPGEPDEGAYCEIGGFPNEGGGNDDA